MNNERNGRRALLNAIDTVTQPLVAVLISFLLGAVVILVIGKNPLLAYAEMIRGAFGKQVYLMNTLKRATPIIMGGLAVCVAWRSGYEAMGGEGQMILGAMAAALVGYYLPAPGWLRIPAKKRRIDPMVMGLGRTSRLFPDFADDLAAFMAQPQDYWVLGV